MQIAFNILQYALIVSVLLIAFKNIYSTINFLDFFQAIPITLGGYFVYLFIRNLHFNIYSCEASVFIHDNWPTFNHGPRKSTIDKYAT